MFSELQGSSYYSTYLRRDRPEEQPGGITFTFKVSLVVLYVYDEEQK